MILHFRLSCIQLFLSLFQFINLYMIGTQLIVVPPDN